MDFIKNNLEQIVRNALSSLNFPIDENLEIIRDSDRPDLSDFQSNIALSLAKSLKQNPRNIAQNIVDNIHVDGLILSIDGPGFINFVLDFKLVEKFLSQFINNNPFNQKCIDNPPKIIVDYGGPNVAKSLHVGHLRASIIGEALKNLAKFKGYNVVGDIHLGDWGLPMGLIIASIKEKGLKLPIDIDTLNTIYPEASKKSKEDKAFMQIAQDETKKLQNKDETNFNMWKSFRQTSLNEIKKTLDILNIDFDLWLGESDANDDVNMLVSYLHNKGFTSPSQGAEIIDLANNPMGNTQVPPFIVVKSNGAIMYGMTDLATIYDRVERQNADFIWYVVDSRQALHFHQVFSVAKLTSIAKHCKLEHLGFGAVLGSDAKPLKTRSGDNVSLNELIDETLKSAKIKIDENEKSNLIPEEEKNIIAKDVAISALKFADLINPRTSDYIFNVDKFVSFEGKTGPYILYSAVRIKSLLKDIDVKPSNIIIDNEWIKKLALFICKFDDVIDKAFDNRAINILAQYIYDLAVIYNNFYHNVKILSQENLELKNSYLYISKITLNIFQIFANIIKINIPERM